MHNAVNREKLMILTKGMLADCKQKTQITIDGVNKKGRVRGNVYSFFIPEV